MSMQNEDWLPRHRLTIDDYYRIGGTGVLASDARTELINGEIIDMTPPGSRHSGIVSYPFWCRSSHPSIDHFPGP
jgi:Uma2 family endonuclease